MEYKLVKIKNYYISVDNIFSIEDRYDEDKTVVVHFFNDQKTIIKYEEDEEYQFKKDMTLLGYLCPNIKYNRGY